MTSRLRVVVLGGSGMLGHKLLQTLHPRFDVFGTVRSEATLRRCRSALPGFPTDHLASGIDALNFATVRKLIEALKPTVVVNCIGVVKQSDDIQQAVPSIQLNALLPHLLARLCDDKAIRLIQFSTDCVFSGRRGNYTEDDLPDPLDLYGRSKLLGEVDQPGSLTLRTSIVGWELEHHRSLLEWFATQRGRRINGYTGAIFSGLNTLELARLVGHLIDRWPALSGVYHVASAPISKFDLLCGLKQALGWTDIEVVPDASFICNRSLDPRRFGEVTGWTAEPWSGMIAALAEERSMYERGTLTGKNT
jgi:dTDP-4-dehydrorhamnose reductase